MSLKKGDLIATKGVVWQVIAVNDESSLIITKNIIARLPYYVGESDDCRGYIDSAIRKWLNESFLSSLPCQFVDMLAETELVNSRQVEGVSNENRSLQNEERFADKIFLLTEEEAMALFPDNTSRKAAFSLDYLRYETPKAFAVLSNDEKESAFSCTEWYLRPLNPDKHYVVTRHGTVEQCLPVTISENELSILERHFYKSMDINDFQHLLFKNLVQRYGVYKLDMAYVATMIRNQVGLGIRPAAWIKNNN